MLPALATVLIASLGWCFYAIAPPHTAMTLVAIFVWCAVPGVIIARRLYGSQQSHQARQGRWLAAGLIGPVWGFSFTSVVLLVLWVLGARNPWILAVAPLGAMLLTWPVSRLRDSLTLPEFNRRDLIPIILVLGLVPLVDGRPFSRVGEMRPAGKAYRAYFPADFEWAMAVVAEVSKGDMPRNPFMSGDRLHYYWLPDLLSSIEYRSAGRAAAIEPFLLVNGILLDLAFIAFFYFFIRQFVHSPPAAAAACVMVVLFFSFEGAERLYQTWREGGDYWAVRNLNIDAVSAWVYNTLKVDGLQRLLLYQPHHATAWAVSLSALVMILQARDAGSIAINLWAGCLLAVGLLLSPFLTAMVGVVIAIYQFAVLVAKGRWASLITAGIAGGVPVGAAVLASNLLQYVDRSDSTKLVYVGHLNPFAKTNLVVVALLDFGPLLIPVAFASWLAIRRRATNLAVLGLSVVVSVFFFLYVDVIDHKHQYVSWKAAHLLFMTFAPLMGFGIQELATMGRRARMIGGTVATILVVGAIPTIAIDLYNTQDTSNSERTVVGRWTLILAPEELEALKWIKDYIPPDAELQPDPMLYTEGNIWAYIPAFAERRMTAGVPISMIPQQKYADASLRVQQVFLAKSAQEAHALARKLGLQYIYLGPPEQTTYPSLGSTLDSAPGMFRPLFRNSAVTIYQVT